MSETALLPDNTRILILLSPSHTVYRRKSQETLFFIFLFLSATHTYALRFLVLHASLFPSSFSFFFFRPGFNAPGTTSVAFCSRVSLFFVLSLPLPYLVRAQSLPSFSAGMAAFLGATARNLLRDWLFGCGSFVTHKINNCAKKSPPLTGRAVAK